MKYKFSKNSENYNQKKLRTLEDFLEFQCSYKKKFKKILMLSNIVKKHNIYIFATIKRTFCRKILIVTIFLPFLKALSILKC